MVKCHSHQMLRSSVEIECTHTGVKATFTYGVLTLGAVKSLFTQCVLTPGLFKPFSHRDALTPGVERSQVTPCAFKLGVVTLCSFMVHTASVLHSETRSCGVSAPIYSRLDAEHDASTVEPKRRLPRALLQQKLPTQGSRGSKIGTMGAVSCQQGCSRALQTGWACNSISGTAVVRCGENQRNKVRYPLEMRLRWGLTQ